MTTDDKHNHEIAPEGAEHDEQPLEHIRPLAPEEPKDPDRPTAEDGMGTPVPLV